MISKIFDRKEFYVIASILLAIIFWFYVRQVEDPEQSKVINDVAVVLTGETVLENQGLTIASVSVDEVSLQVHTNISVLDQLNNSNVYVEVDVAKIASAGEYELNYTEVLPTTFNTSGVIIESRTPQKITVTVEKLYAETFPIEFVLKGSIAEGYQAGEYTMTPETVTISGSVEEISQIDSVVVLLEREDLSQRFASDLPIILLDADGAVLTDLAVKMSVETAYVILPVVVVKEIPLTVKITEGGGATESDIRSLQILPETITVSGAEEDMSALSEISLGSFDLSDVVGSETFTFPINLDPSLHNVSGITEAEVSVSLYTLATKSYDVTNIELIGIPEGYTAEASTQVRTVIVRGDQDVLESIDPSQLRIVADLSHISAIGSSSVPVKVYLDATAEAGVIGDYTIIVNVSN